MVAKGAHGDGADEGAAGCEDVPAPEPIPWGDEQVERQKSDEPGGENESEGRHHDELLVGAPVGLRSGGKRRDDEHEGVEREPADPRGDGAPEHALGERSSGDWIEAHGVGGKSVLR